MVIDENSSNWPTPNFVAGQENIFWFKNFQGFDPVSA
jgi:hypothetical protein